MTDARNNPERRIRQPDLFDPAPFVDNDLPLEPAPDGMGADAARTFKQRQLIARSIHPATGFPLHPTATKALTPTDPKTGTTCGDCWHLYKRQHPNGKTWLKCGRRGPGLDLRKWWPACAAYLPTPKEKP